MGLVDTEALILRTYNLAEADKIVVTLTRSAGLVRGVAKGCRKLRNRFGASLELRKLLVYPIPHDKLFLVEILLRITTCFEMLILTLGPVVGLLRNPHYGWRASPRILGGALIFISMNILLSAGTRNWLERLFVKSRLKELMMFVFVFASVLPQFVLRSQRPKQSIMNFVPSQIFWPWAAPARVMLQDSVWLSLFASLIWIAGAFVFSRWQFERGIRFDGSSVRPKAKESGLAKLRDSLADRLVSLPGRLLPDPLAALVEKELRTLFRIPRFRLVYLMSCLFGVVFYLPALLRGHNQGTFFFLNTLPLLSLYGLLLLGQISYWNSLGFDRSAVQGYFSWPVRFRQVLIAKNLCVVALILPQILVIATVCRAVRIPVSLGKLLETVVVIWVAALYWFALGNISSVRIPRALDPDKMNQMSNRLQALTIFIAPFLLLPIGLAYWSRWFFESDLLFVGILALAAVIGVIFYGVGLDSAVETAFRQREKIVQELSRSDGPLSIT